MVPVSYHLHGICFIYVDFEIEGYAVQYIIAPFCQVSSTTAGTRELKLQKNMAKYKVARLCAFENVGFLGSHKS